MITGDTETSKEEFDAGYRSTGHGEKNEKVFQLRVVSSR
jgi:hypothetical protein